MRLLNLVMDVARNCCAWRRQKVTRPMSQDFPQPDHSRMRPRFRGIVADARALGVSRDHLWRVLVGDRQSLSLLKRYNALQTKKRKQHHRRQEGAAAR